MSNPMAVLLDKAVETKYAVQRMMALLNFAVPPTQDLEHILSVEFFYPRKKMVGKLGRTGNGCKPKADTRHQPCGKKPESKC